MCRKIASHAGDVTSVSASCGPGNFPYAIARYALLLLLGFPLLGADPTNPVLLSLADVRLEAFRSPNGAL